MGKISDLAIKLRNDQKAFQCDHAEKVWGFGRLRDLRKLVATETDTETDDEGFYTTYETSR